MNMSMPGFTAESSLHATRLHHPSERSTARGRSGSAVRPASTLCGPCLPYNPSVDLTPGWYRLCKELTYSGLIYIFLPCQPHLIYSGPLPHPHP